MQCSQLAFKAKAWCTQNIELIILFIQWCRRKFIVQIVAPGDESAVSGILYRLDRHSYGSVLSRKCGTQKRQKAPDTIPSCLYFVTRQHRIRDHLRFWPANGRIRGIKSMPSRIGGGRTPRYVCPLVFDFLIPITHNLRMQLQPKRPGWARRDSKADQPFPRKSCENTRQQVGNPRRARVIEACEVANDSNTNQVSRIRRRCTGTHGLPCRVIALIRGLVLSGKKCIRVAFFCYSTQTALKERNV